MKLSGSSLKFKIKKESLDGNRLLDLERLQHHVCFCPGAQEPAHKSYSPMSLRSEMNKTGLVNVILAKCQGCRETFPLQTSQTSNSLFDFNVGSVWGTVTSGGDLNQLNRIMGTLHNQQMSNPILYP